MDAVTAIPTIMYKLTSASLVDALENFWANIFVDNHAGEPLHYVEGPASSGNLLLLASISLAVIIIIALFVLFLCSKLQNLKISRKFLKRSFLFAWFFAFIVYDVGMYTGQYISLITNAPMSILHAFETFLLGSDVSTIHDSFHKSWIFMCAFSLAHAMSACVSMLFVIKVFGFNLIQKWKLFKERIFGKSKKETYVLWGVNSVTYNMVESIIAHYKKEEEEKKGNEEYRIVIVKTSNDDDNSSESAIGIKRIFALLSLKDAEVQKLQQLKCFITNSTRRGLDSLSELFYKNNDGKIDVINGELQLRTLAKLLDKRKTTEKIHFLLLSDDEQQNLHDISVLLQDSTLKNYAASSSSPDEKDKKGAKKREVIFYCHARYNSVHRVIEDVADANREENISVKVIDSSHLNVEMLKTNKNLLPVNFVDVEADATVSSSFNALVVGFSEVGLDSARFLYEFGAFVKTGSDNRKVERSDFHLDIVDGRMSALAGTFVANAPAIKPSLPFIKGMENDSALIALHEIDCRSVEFYHKLEEWIKRLNYIVIATEDDEFNISLGIRIFKIAIRYRKDLDKFCILVRAHNDDDGHIRKIAIHYNCLWKAQKAAEDNPIKNLENNQNTFKRVKKDGKDVPTMPLTLFGLDKKVYTYENIIDDKLEKDAIEFKDLYAASTNANQKKDDQKDAEQTKVDKKDDTAWMKEFNKLMQLDIIKNNDGKEFDVRPYHPTYSALMRLRRTQRQDFANSLHRITKICLAEKGLNGLGMPLFDWESLSRKNEEITYTLSTGGLLHPGIIRILDVLAQTEHMRWNASHEILGYRNTDIICEECDVDKQTIQNDLCPKALKNDSKDKCEKECKYNLKYKNEKRLIHNCIRPWESLDTITKSYDYNVVDVTLGIINKNRPIKSNKS